MTNMNDQNLLDIVKARRDFSADRHTGFYLPSPGEGAYETEYRRLTAECAWRCARAGDAFLSAAERRWYTAYKEYNP
jgi:hypothetical protein